MLEVMKNNMLGRLHYPHPYFIEKGIHSVSLVTSMDPKKILDQKQVLSQFFIAFEHLVRSMDQLDEQLNAGYFIYILTSAKNFMPMDVFVWGFSLLLGGLLFPVVLNYATHHELLTKWKQ